MKEGYADNRFASLYYKELGQGVPLVMLMEMARATRYSDGCQNL